MLIRSAKIITIKKLVKFQTPIIFDNKYIGSFKHVPPNLIKHPTAPPTHEIHCDSRGDATKPGQELAIHINISDGGQIKRPCNSTAIICNNQAYSIVTWNDLGRESQFHRRTTISKVVDGSPVLYLKKLNKQHTTIILQELAKFQGLMLK